MANFESPFATAQGSESQGYLNNMAATTWPDYAGAASQLQFAQMLPQQSGWFQNPGAFSDVWYPSQGYADASMLAALNAKLQSSPELWMQQLMQAGASQSQMLQQQILQRQLAQSQGTSQLESARGSQAQTKPPAGLSTMAPPGISSTTPIKAGSSVAVPGDKPTPKAPVPTSTGTNDAGAKAGKILLNLVNNKEERPPQQAGAVLLQQLKGGGTRKVESGRPDAGAGLALLQQVKAGSLGAPPKNDAWAYDGDSRWWSWDEWGHGKAGKKGKTGWNGDWWGYGQDWEDWHERWVPTPQGRSKKGKAKAGRQVSSQETSDASNDSDDSPNQPQAGANSRWRKPAAGRGAGKGQPASTDKKTRWKPAANGK